MMYLILLFSLAAYAQDINGLVQKKYPGAKVVEKKDCDLGAAKVKTTGLLIQLKDSLKVAVVLKDSLQEIPATISYAKGSDGNYLSDYWMAPKGYSGSFTIKCIVPGKDADVTPEANGAFHDAFKGKTVGNHLCFSASTTYNNWACYNFGAKNNEVVPSYSQLNAD